ncbi:MAG: septum formation initiator family protein [Acutalibacteraceae bacterium]
MKKKKRKNKSILLRIMILGVCVYMLATLSVLWNTLNESRKELDALKAQYATEQNDIDELRAMLEDGSEAKIIEKAARERLGYVYPDEQVFIDISGN